ILRPAIETTAAVDQLGADADGRGRAADTSGDDACDAEALGGSNRVAVPQHFRRGSGDDLETSQSGKGIAQFLRDSIGEIALRRIAAEIFEWQDGDGVRLRAGRAEQQPSAGPGSGGSRGRATAD